MKLEVGKTYVLKVIDQKSVELLHEYTKTERIARNVYPNVLLTSRILLFVLSVCVTPLLMITVPLMKKYPMATNKPTKFGVK